MNRPVYAKAYASSQQSDKTLSKLEFTTNINSTVKVRKGPNPDRLVLRNDTSERVVIATLFLVRQFKIMVFCLQIQIRLGPGLHGSRSTKSLKETF